MLEAALWRGRLRRARAAEFPSASRTLSRRNSLSLTSTSIISAGSCFDRHYASRALRLPACSLGDRRANASSVARSVRRRDRNRRIDRIRRRKKRKRRRRRRSIETRDGARAGAHACIAILVPRRSVWRATKSYSCDRPSGKPPPNRRGRPGRPARVACERTRRGDGNQRRRLRINAALRSHVRERARRALDRHPAARRLQSESVALIRSNP